MLDRYLQPRHWSPYQPYATGDVVIDMMAQGWEVISAHSVPAESRARLHTLSLVRSGETIEMLVLDGPVIRDLVLRLSPA